jgi:hypothetical protein
MSFISTKTVITLVGHLSSTFFTMSSYSKKFPTLHASPLLASMHEMVRVVSFHHNHYKSGTTYFKGKTCILQM